jgi:protein-L-isoaspartate(D-aspartate) O-methyltransferase
MGGNPLSEGGTGPILNRRETVMVRNTLTRVARGLMAITVLVWGRAAWTQAQDTRSAQETKNKPAAAADPTAAARNRMVQRHLVERDIKNPRVLEAFRTVPRHRFLPENTRRQAYDDESIPIGESQTITPPYDVAFMTQVLDPKPTDKVYEVGTGSGYQSAILSRLVKEVYSVEIHASLSERATKVHHDLGYKNIHTRVGDGYEGWPEAAPFDAIIVTCAPHRIPKPLLEQLKEGGRMVIPLGDRFTQSVHLVIKKDGKLIDKELKPTLFVPMTGKALKEGPEPKAGSEEPAPEQPKATRGRGRSTKSQGKASAKEPS